MKRGLLALPILVLFLCASLAWFLGWPASLWARDSVSVLLIGQTQGGMADRDQAVQGLIREALERKAEQQGLSLSLHALDSTRSIAELQQALDELGDIDVAIGCADSVCVRHILPLLEAREISLIYPGSSEGLFDSSALIHLGLVANQYLFPAVSWVQQHLGADLFYLGSESARSRMLGRMLNSQLLPATGLPLIGEEYVGTLEQLPSLADKILTYQPDVVMIDACEWFERPEFVRMLASVPARKFSLCVDQRPPLNVDMYFVSHYYDNVHNPVNLRLKERISHPDGIAIMALAAVDFFIAAHGHKSTSVVERVTDQLRGRNALTASGSMAVDFQNAASWHSVFIGRHTGQKEQLLWVSQGLMRPVMFPGLEAPSDWQHHLTIYWRNNGGLWRSGSVQGEPWL